MTDVTANLILTELYCKRCTEDGLVGYIRLRWSYQKVYREICASAIKNNGYVIREISKGITR